MEEKKRVYPRDGFPAKWLRNALLFLSAILLLSGFLWRGTDDNLMLSVSATPTPIPTGEAFDETVESRELLLPATTWYALQLGAFDNEEAAQSLAQGFRQRGAAGYVWKDTRYRTLAAVYASSEDAQRVRENLQSNYQIDAYPYEIALPAMTLRVRGMKGQMDILEAGFIHAHDLISQLQSLALSLDRQEQSVSEADDFLLSLGEQVQTVSLRLEQRFTPPRPAPVEGLIGSFARFAAYTRDREPEQSSVQMATDVKYQTFTALRDLYQIYADLSNT